MNPTGNAQDKSNNGKCVMSEEGSELKGYGYRHQQCLILFVSFTIAYSMRSYMGVSLVAMVEREPNGNHKHILLNNLSVPFANHSLTVNESYKSINIVTAFETNDTEKEEFKTNGFLGAILFAPPYPTFQWTKKTQDLILAAFQFGYMALQIPAGQLAHRFGARLLLTGSMIINCVVSFCIPWAAYYGGSTAAVICRVLQGASQACIVPGLHTFFGKWAPLEERARLAGFVFGGQALGTVFGLPMTGFIAASSMGWPGIFRFYGLLSGIIGVVLYYMLVDSPAQHPKISKTERHYIEEGLGQKTGSKAKHLPVPWSRIFRCKGLYAIILAHIGQTWGQLTLYSEVPAFMDKIMGVNIKANGVLTALPFLVMWFTNFFFSWLTDMLIVKKIMSVTNARKLANSLGFLPAAIGLIALAYVPKNIYAVETILIVVCAFKIAANVGFHVNHIDISPNFAGTLMSISNFVSNVGGAMAPLVAGYILTDVSDERLWRQVFFISAGLYIFSDVMYVMFGTGELADWNNPQEDHLKDLEDAHEADPMVTGNNDQPKQNMNDMGK